MCLGKKIIFPSVVYEVGHVQSEKEDVIHRLAILKVCLKCGQRFCLNGCPFIDKMVSLHCSEV